MSTTIDDSGAIRKIQSLTQKLSGSGHRRAVLRATRKGGNLLKKEVRKVILDNSKYEHIDFIKRNVKVINSRSKGSPGVTIRIKGPDVPVGTGKHRIFWKLTSYSMLVFKGNYKSPNRRTKKGVKRGNVKGTNPESPFNEVASQYGKKAIEIAKDFLVPELEKEIAKLGI